MNRGRPTDYNTKWEQLLLVIIEMLPILIKILQINGTNLTMNNQARIFIKNSSFLINRTRLTQSVSLLCLYGRAVWVLDNFRILFCTKPIQKDMVNENDTLRGVNYHWKIDFGDFFSRFFYVQKKNVIWRVNVAICYLDVFEALNLLQVKQCTSSRFDAFTTLCSVMKCYFESI